MSAYALSGALFPPITIGETSSLASSSPTNAAGPLQEVSKSLDPSSSSLDDGATANDTQDNGAICSPEVGIEVKAARIDPLRLVQPQSGRSKFSAKGANTRKQSLQNRSIDVVGEPDKALDPPHSSRDQKTEIRQSDPAGRATGPDVGTPHSDAIQFELSISLNGRVYSATRTLPRIIQLRNELIRELDVRRQASRLRRMRWRRTPEKMVQSLTKDDDTAETVDEYSDLDQALDLFIPELPDCLVGEAETAASGGFGSRGFRMVQALLRSYCPAVERWLRNVADVVPPDSSPCLTNFLWEPLSQSFGSNTQESTNSNTSSFKTHGSLATLDSIDEAADGMSEEDISEADGTDVGALYFDGSCRDNL